MSATWTGDVFLVEMTETVVRRCEYSRELLAEMIGCGIDDVEKYLDRNDGYGHSHPYEADTLLNAVVAERGIVELDIPDRSWRFVPSWGKS